MELMETLQLLPLFSYVGCAIAILLIATGATVFRKINWLIPTVLALIFTVFTIYQISQEGLIQFWVNHTNSFAGNQVWFDLVMAISIGFYMLAPRARSVGMSLIPWGVAVIATACIALLPMLARVLWLENKTASMVRSESDKI